MKYKLMLLIALLYCLSVYSQEKFSSTPGKVTQHEMSMTQYDKDPDAEALTIYDKGAYRFRFDDHEGLFLEMTRRTKIKILSQAGEKYATFEIPIYIDDSRNMEGFTLLQATTYNLENGKLTEDLLTKNNIFEERINEKWRCKKFTMPNVRAGSVIEIEYSIRTPYFENLRTWEMQQKIPVLSSSLEYRAIPYYEYVFQVNGTNKLDRFDSEVNNHEIRHGRLVYKEMVYNFEKKNIPAFRDERFITSEKDYMIAIKFQLSRIHYPTGGKRDYMSTWPDLCNELLKHSNYGKYIKSAQKEAKKILPTLNLDEKSEVDKIRAITEYVKNNYSWNGFYGKFSTQKVSDLLKKKSGNIADLNLFLVGLLQEAGINVNPIISSTRDNGMIRKEYPFAHIFNYTLAQVKTNENRQIFIDCTDSILPYNMVPTRCINTLALVVEPKVEEWTFIEQRLPSYIQKNIEITINPDNKAKVKALFTTMGSEARNFRANYMGESNKLKNYLQKAENINKITNLNVASNDHIERPFSFQFEFDQPTEVVSNKLFINPFSGLQVTENIFNQKERQLPIDLIYTIRRQYVSTINIPEGYKVEFVPEKLQINNELMTIDYQANILDDKNISLQASFALTQNMYAASDYEKLKQLYANMISKFGEMVILVKDETTN